MFSIHLAESEGRRPDRRSLPERLFGRFLGLSAGLVLVAAADAVLLDHLLRQSITEGFRMAMPSLTHAMRDGWAMAAGR